MSQQSLNKALYDKRQAIKRGDKYKFICIVLSFGFAAQIAIISKSIAPLILYFGVLAAVKLKKLYDKGE